MTLFPWLVLILVLVLVAELVLATPGALRSARAEHRLRLARPTLRALVIVTTVELALILVWGLVLRPR
jgi:hypothetical protein